MGILWKIKSNKYLKKLVRLFYPYGSIRTVLFGPIRGCKFIVSPSMGITYALGEEIIRMNFLGKYIKEGMQVYDIGANIGHISLYLSQLVGKNGVVYSFEPSPYDFNILNNNITLNGINNVVTINSAISNIDGKEQYLYNSEKSTKGRFKSVGIESFQNLPMTEELSVDACCLDTFIKNGNKGVDFIKIDVEGSAEKVLMGARNLIKSFKPYIYIELHNGNEQIAVKNELIDNGYTVETLDGLKITDTTKEWHNPLWCYVE